MNRETATKAGAIAVAVGASACCWLPLLLVAIGAGATGAGAMFESLRPYLMAATVVLLGTAFYFVYRRRPACDDGSCAPATGRRGRATLWAIAALAAVSFAFPLWSEARLDAANARADADSGEPAFTIPVAGMTCAACAVSVHKAVAGVPGVVAARVEQSPGQVHVWIEGPVEPQSVMDAIRAAGYRPGVPGVSVPPTRTAYLEVKGMVQQLGIT